jgi:hypothetical protein
MSSSWRAKRAPSEQVSAAPAARSSIYAAAQNVRCGTVRATSHTQHSLSPGHLTTTSSEHLFFLPHPHPNISHYMSIITPIPFKFEFRGAPAQWSLYTTDAKPSQEVPLSPLRKDSPQKYSGSSVKTSASAYGTVKR